MGPLRSWTIFLVLPALLSTGSAFAAPGALNVSTTILSKNTCLFVTKNAFLDFGTLDPLNPVDVTATASLDYRCQGTDDPASYAVSHDDGLNETGPGASRLQHTADGSQFIPYSISLDPTAGTAPTKPPLNQSLTLTGTLLGADYQNALMGTYTDLITVTIMP